MPKGSHFGLDLSICTRCKLHIIVGFFRSADRDPFAAIPAFALNVHFIPERNEAAEHGGPRLSGIFLLSHKLRMLDCLFSERLRLLYWC